MRAIDKLYYLRSLRSHFFSVDVLFHGPMLLLMLSLICLQFRLAPLLYVNVTHLIVALNVNEFSII